MKPNRLINLVIALDQTIWDRGYLVTAFEAFRPYLDAIADVRFWHLADIQEPSIFELRASSSV
jgi:hypothetical protein